MEKRRTSIVRILRLLIIVGAVAAVVFFVILPTWQYRKYSRMLSDALVNARSVTLVELDQPFLNGELVFQRVPASAAQVDALGAATGGWVERIQMRANCFKPHHRIEVIRADGSEFRFEICFQCNNFGIGDLGLQTLPSQWRARFEKIFTDAGMPPLKDYQERARKHPDYPRLEQEFQTFGAELEEEMERRRAAKDAKSPAP